MLKLNQLRDNKGSKRVSKDLGRGIGSGKGKTAGRGGKGQTARSGVAVKNNEGGQMPLFRRLPKRGFTNYTRVEYDVINLRTLQALLDKGTLKASDKIDGDLLVKKLGEVSKINNSILINFLKLFNIFSLHITLFIFLRMSIIKK